VLVGDEEAAFTVHEALICKHSDFFTAACSGEWKEGQTRTVRLPAPNDPAHFQLYLDWLYSQRLVNVTELVRKGLVEQDVSTQSGAQGLHVVDGLCDLWILGNYLLDTSFKNTMISRVITNEVPRGGLILLSTVKKIIKGTPTDSGIQRWLLDHLGPLITAQQLEEAREWLPAQFVFHLLKKMTNFRDKVNNVKTYLPQKADYRKYHDGVEETKA